MEWAGKTFLVLDAATPLVQAGVWRDGEWLAWEGARGGAETCLFESVKACIGKSGRGIRDMDGFLFCEGPGSTLGIRISAMAIKGWQTLFAKPRPVYSYFSLEMLAGLLVAGGREPPFTVISDARRGFWNASEFSADGAPAKLARVPAEELPGLPSPFFRLEEPRKTPCPVEAEEVVLDLSAAPGLFLEPSLRRRNDEAAIFSPAMPEYKRWTAQRHRQGQ